MPVISPPLHQKSKSERQRTSGFMAKEVLLYFKTMLAVSIKYTMHQNLLLNPVTNEVKSIVQEAYKNYAWLFRLYHPSPLLSFRLRELLAFKTSGC
jgi:hypothetical protein